MIRSSKQSTLDCLEQDVAEPEEPLTFPCTPTQERFWYMEKLAPGNAALNVALRWEIRGEVRRDCIEQAFRALVERHEILRTSFIERDGAPLQRVHQSVPFRLSYVDLTILSESLKAAEVDFIAQRDATSPFDLGSAPLIRVTAVRTAEDRVVLLVVVHHMAADGWSIRLLGREVGAVMSALQQGRPVELDPLPLQYGDYALWYSEYLRCAEFDNEASYWLEQLAAAPYFELDADHARPARRSYRSAMVSAALGPAFSAQLETVAARHGVSTFTLGYAVLAAFLQRESGKTDIVVGTQAAGRDDVDLEPLIGVFINNLVLRVDAGGDPQFHELLARSNEVVLGALEHQKLPFHKLVELLRPVRDPSRSPLVSVNLIVQRAFFEDTSYEQFEMVGLPSTSPGALHDLTFLMVGRADGWRMSLEYSVDLFEEHTALRLLASWKAVLEATCANPAIRLSGLPRPNRTPVAPSLRAPEVVDLPFAASAPLNQQESEVAAIWREILGVSAVGPNSNFFELGGHSLLAMRMLVRVEGALRRQVDIATLLHAPSLRAFVAAATAEPNERHTGERASRTEERSSQRARSSRLAALSNAIVPIRASGNKSPVFVLNNTAVLFPLARALGDDYPIFALQLCPATQPAELPQRDFRDLARDVVEMVRLCRPEGPYVLMGLCVFGALALEVAQQLRADGDEVELVVINDSWAPGYSQSLTWQHRRLCAWLERAHNVRNDLSRIRRGQKSVSEAVASYRLLRRLKIVDGAMRIGLLEAGVDEAVMRLENRWFTDYLQAARRRYRPAPYDGDVLVFRSDETLRGRFFAPDLGWRSVVRGRLEVMDCPGEHAEMFHAAGSEAMARGIRQLLDDVSSTSRPKNGAGLTLID